MKTVLTILASLFFGYVAYPLTHQGVPIVAANVVAPTPVPTIVPTPTSTQVREMKPANRDGIVIEINDMRLAAGLPQLGTDTSYQFYTDQRLTEITKSCTHNPELQNSLYAKSQRINTEIIACGFPTLGEMMTGWSDSPVHKDAILSKTAQSMTITTDGRNAVVLFEK